MMADTKLTRLIVILKDTGSAVLAFSGGVDSTFLLKAMQLSGIPSLAVTASSEIIPHREVVMAEEASKQLGIAHEVLEMGPLREEFLSNTPERCFLCKTELYRKLTRLALAKGYGCVLDGSNMDDMRDYRPGERAASEFQVRSPLREAELSKSEVRELSRRLGLTTWNRPSSPCLATRIPYGRKITSEALKRIERSEDFLRSLGLHQVRVRDYGHMARIEIGEDEIEAALTPGRRKIISETLKSLGYKFVSLDLDGYQTGSMDRILEDIHRIWNARDI